MTFTAPTSKFELIDQFLNLSEGAQRIYLAVLTFGAADKNSGSREVVAELLTALRNDEQTRELVTKLETTSYVKLPKSKAHRRR